MSANTKQEFGKVRSLLWPIHAHELKKLVPMLLMFFFISFNYTIMRDTKDTLIVNFAKADAIPWLKFFVFFSAVVFFFIYSKLSNMLSVEALFYVIIIPFILFFGLYALVLYPASSHLTLDSSAEALRQMIPVGWKGLASAWRYWMHSLFYIMSELWGSAILSLMYWGFANQITRVNEAKRFYSLLGVGANIALMVSGPIVFYFSNAFKGLPESERWQLSLNWLMSFVVIAGLAVIAIYWWMNRNVLTDPRFYDPSQEKSPGKKKPKLSIWEGIKYIASSKYILSIAVLVIAYGISINLVEVTWKNQLGQQYPVKNDYNAFMGIFSTVTGFVTFFMMLFVGGNLIRSKGWGFAAQVTPVVLLITGIAFFFFVVFKQDLEPYITSYVGVTPLFLAVLFGAAQNIMSKSSKYSLFDPTKEMAYIPLDPDGKTKGKAAVDVVGARLGKFGGSGIQLGLMAFATLDQLTAIIGAILVVIIVLWIMAVRSLSKQFTKLTADQSPAVTGLDRNPAKAV